MTAEDVDRAIIKPMTSMYPAPRHLRADEDAADATLRAYRKALARFDEPVLEQAWDRAVRENGFWCWPKLADLVRYAEQAQRAAHPHGQGAAPGWFAEAEALTDAYTRRFMKTSQAAARAREGGYERELREYVRAAGWVQAQIIAGREEGVSYDGVVLFGNQMHRDEEQKEREAEFFAKARDQAARGSIRVHVPQELVQRWRQQAEDRGAIGRANGR